MNGDFGFLAWLAFLAATVIFVLLAVGTITDLTMQYWGFGLISFGLAFGGWWGSRRGTPPHA